MSTVFDLVLGAFREPGLVAELREKELPDELALVIHLAAGEDAALRSAADTTGEDAETLIEASVFFLQQVLFAPGADAYRVLGASSGSTQERLRENYRWLMKWLHPDRNQDGWEAVYADRVTIAWQDLKTAERRAEYDRKLPSGSPLAPMNTGLVRRAAPVSRAASGPLLSGSTVRRLPALVLGTLAALAAATVGITYWAQSETTRELTERQRDRNGAVVEPLPTAAPAAFKTAEPDPLPAPDPQPGVDIEPDTAVAIAPEPSPAGSAAATAPAIAPAAGAATVIAMTSSQPLPAAQPEPRAPVPATVAQPSVARASAAPAPAAATVQAPEAYRPIATAVPLAIAPATAPARTAISPETRAGSAVDAAREPAALAPTAAPAPPAPPAQSDAEALVREFASAYAAGDLVRFDRLLSSARLDAATLDPMRSRFASTEMRYLEIQQLRWHPEAEQGHVRARFRDTYVPRGGRKAVTESGEFQWTIRVDAGDAHIASVARNDASP